MSLATKAFAGFDIDDRHVRVVVTDAAVITDAAAAARTALDTWLDIVSLTRADSELQRLNRSFGRTVRVSPALADQLRHALDAATLTSGAVDPLRTQSTDTHDAIEIEGLDVRLPAWATLDLDATALAVVVERIAATIARRFGCGALVSVSGAHSTDTHIAVAGPESARGWQISVIDGSAERLVPIASGTTVVTSTATTTATVAAPSPVVAAAWSRAAAAGADALVDGAADHASATVFIAA
ncbi:FAD:protein FMN transferase [Rhodococcus sp. BP-349]|uniref:FAD:protein FMN transferase n=1 Tax=unclassified Rhodococcus (in: high G+C Gram-positive bacteria) TaxID=192944 RepID=UPI001C9B9659|nr:MULTISPECIES: FAD:protein FMN transferase [unclassified Rhodococcus (in: high G+C Gram-positive bacteria)]MBY6538573.1 FAD:protein FMN transferase [Rhodococcus sp. BP-363]MBY6542910.1 FAD:protein FMN transferase [Rhodococcus sp. BP-369]MBY6562140.1 FAD:protein FMN transferase [Rhodococcus sp. BP-370]MBY6576432.1 FAD:protein FMN transferase [Rhodococcus sp. BP-364]MBY6585733.1 FAD:protein FMN transferase [Rhodococcus sp. BP-358]